MPHPRSHNFSIKGKDYWVVLTLKFYLELLLVVEFLKLSEVELSRSKVTFGS